MKSDIFTIRKLLDEELDRRCYASGIAMKTEGLFDKNSVKHWIESLVGKSISGKLSTCIENTSTERLSHAAAVYLLGMALRSRLGLHFDRMPRIIAHSASDGFHFFWAITCLCHDLGYRFENCSWGDQSICEKMNTPQGRKELLNIDHDLFLVNQEELTALGIDPDSEEGRWILESVELMVKYDRYRRRADESDQKGVADHGICGALLLYDILRAECEEMHRKRRMRRFGHPERHSENEPVGNLDGAAKDSSPTRFIRCGLLIACTVARHNMWLAAPKYQPLYRMYGLEALFADRPGVKVRADSPMEQMLFFLDFVDTIDPVKGFYLRDVENGPEKGECSRCYAERLQRQYDFLLNHVYLDIPHVEDDCAERYFTIRTDAWDRDDLLLFREFTGSTCSLPDWLEMSAPILEADRITYRIPFVSGEKNVWPCGITDHEVNSLLLYMGCGVPGLYGAFYSSSRAYQTFNLLMMPGNEGEQIRVCEEKQRPDGIFLREWERSLETMADIFRAQCKYARDNSPIKDALFRSDRKLNFDLMYDRKATYAMTSTSQGSYLPEFLVDKVEPHVLRIRMTKRVPFFDYQAFFGEEYVFADEREILLPPMLALETAQQPDFILSAKESGAEKDIRVRWYDVTLGGFAPDSMQEADRSASDDKSERAYLKAHAEEAAQALDELARGHNWKTSPLAKPEHVYWQWKRTYRRILGRRLKDIYSQEFTAK